MDKIVAVLGTGLPSLFGRFDDDFADRLSHVHTSTMLIVFAVIVSTKQFVGDAINCWVPAHFTGNHEEYTNNFCWVRNTYYLPFDEQVPVDDLDSSRRMVSFYQWVPLILLVEALVFHVPIIVWRTLSGRSGIYIRNLIDYGQTLVDTDLSHNRDTMLRFMAQQVDRFLLSQRARHKYDTDCTLSVAHCFTRCCFVRCCGRRYGNYLTVVYLCVKLLFVANAVIQLFALNFFLGQDFHLYGVHVVRALISGADWTASERFPRVTMCDLRIRRLGTVQRYTVQCVLPINLFNEKIFLLLWFWLAFVAAASTASLVLWSVRAIFDVDRVRYVRKHLQLMNRIGARAPDRSGATSDVSSASSAAGSSGNILSRHRQLRHRQKSASSEKSGADADKIRVRRFVSEYLKADGVFILRLVSHNTNAVTVTELTCALWDGYREKEPADDDIGIEVDVESGSGNGNGSKQNV